MRRLALVLGLGIVTTTNASSVAGAESVPVEVVVRARQPVRVRVSEGSATPCDASPNRVLYDGMVAGDGVVRSAIATEAICVEHTWDDFPRSGWAPAGIARRPKICKGKRCWPAPDPTIRVELVATRR